MLLSQTLSMHFTEPSFSLCAQIHLVIGKMMLVVLWCFVVSCQKTVPSTTTPMSLSLSVLRVVELLRHQQLTVKALIVGQLWYRVMVQSIVGDMTQLKVGMLKHLTPVLQVMKSTLRMQLSI